VQSRLERPTHVLDPDTTVVIEQAGAVKDGQRANVSRPAVTVPQQGTEVLGVQPFQHAYRGHDVALPDSWIVTQSLPEDIPI
jgi:hypothetical protein